MEPSTTPERSLRGPLLVGLAVLVLALGLLAWAKYLPYAAKVPAVLSARDVGPSALPAPGAVSVAAGWSFTVAYLAAVWKALVAGLVLAAAVQVLLPGTWLRRSLGTAGGLRGGLRGGLWSVPTLMCSCCAAPLTLGLRRARVALTTAVAFWLGNPALNPVVLVFCLAVLPWPWAVLRLAGGLLVVTAGIAIARRAEERVEATTVPAEVLAGSQPVEDGPLPLRFVRALAGLAVRLVPEMVAVVLVLGTFGGVLLPGEGALDGVVLVLVLVAVGLALPVPTGGEVAAVAAALAAGLPTAAAAALLVTLPVLNLPSVLMVRGAVPGRVLGGVVAAAATVGLVAAALVAAVVP